VFATDLYVRISGDLLRVKNLKSGRAAQVAPELGDAEVAAKLRG